MKKININLTIYISYILIGIVLNILHSCGILESFWASFGAGIIAVGLLQAIRCIRYKTNKEYREETDTKNNDERSRFLSNKAWAWAGYLFVLIAGISVIVLKIVGQDEWMAMASFSVCLLLILYWLSYLVLSKKY